MAIKVKAQYKTMVKLFDNLTGSRHIWQVFQDCMEMGALSIQNSVEVYPSRREENERKYMNIASGYNADEMQVISEIFAEIWRLFEENPFQDLLGDLYMQLNMGNAEQGQFFTPYHVSQMIAKSLIDIPKAREIISKQGYISIAEPCVGGGANVIAACEWLKENGINYQSDCIIIGQDLSHMSGIMSYIALSAIGCQAVVKIADTLRYPYTNFFEEIATNPSSILYTPIFVLNEGYTRC